LKKINQRKNKKQIAEKKRELQIILDSIPAWIFYKDLKWNGKQACSNWLRENAEEYG